MSKVKRRKFNATGRSAPRFVMLDFGLLRTDAYRSLSCGARAMLIELHLMFNGANNGLLFLSQRDAAKAVGTASHRTAAKYLSELEDRGFIKTRVKGTFSNKTKLATTFILTNQRYNEMAPTRDFRNWKPPQKQKSRKQKLSISDAKKDPSVPECWPDGSHFLPCSGALASADGSNNESTYNIPRGGDVSEKPGATLRTGTGQ